MPSENKRFKITSFKCHELSYIKDTASISDDKNYIYISSNPYNKKEFVNINRDDAIRVFSEWRNINISELERVKDTASIGISIDDTVILPYEEGHIRIPARYWEDFIKVLDSMIHFVTSYNQSN